MSSLWEITQPFRALEDTVISGELHYKSKLSWTKKLVALTSGRLVCYKVSQQIGNKRVIGKGSN